MAKQIAKGINPWITSDSSTKVRGTSRDTTNNVTANANTASLSPSIRETSWLRHSGLRPEDCFFLIRAFRNIVCGHFADRGAERRRVRVRGDIVGCVSGGAAYLCRAV